MTATLAQRRFSLNERAADAKPELKDAPIPAGSDLMGHFAKFVAWLDANELPFLELTMPCGTRFKYVPLEVERRRVEAKEKRAVKP